MSMIKNFKLNQQEGQLAVTLNDGSVMTFTFEFLRVFSPAGSSKGNQLITHKKQVKISNIESVGKHGYRLLFDDTHQAIFPLEYLQQLDRESTQRWQQYLNEVDASQHSREASIEIKEL